MAANPRRVLVMLFMFLWCFGVLGCFRPPSWPVTRDRHIQIREIFAVVTSREKIMYFQGASLSMPMDARDSFCGGRVLTISNRPCRGDALSRCEVEGAHPAGDVQAPAMPPLKRSRMTAGPTDLLPPGKHFGQHLSGGREHGPRSAPSVWLPCRIALPLTASANAVTPSSTGARLAAMSTTPYAFMQSG
jgi:hypothetical protein